MVLRDKKKLYCLSAVFVVMLGLILLLSGKSDNESTNSQQSELYYRKQYCDYVQGMLTDVLSNIDGVGEVKVVVSLSPQADKASIKSDSFFYDENSESLDNSAQIMAVAVICDDVSNIYVKQSIMEVISTLCGISTSKITICQSKRA